MSRVSSTPADFAMCRTLGHAWDQVPADSAPRTGGDPFWCRCVRCGTERHDAVSYSTGELIGRRYVYADGYLHAFDDDFEITPTRQDYRRMLLQDHLTHVRRLRAVRSAR